MEISNFHKGYTTLSGERYEEIVQEGIPTSPSFFSGINMSSTLIKEQNEMKLY